MNKTVLAVLVFLVVVGAWVFAPTLAAHSSFTQGLTTLPEDAVRLIGAAVTAGVAWLLLKVDLGQYTAALAAALAPIVVAVLERLLGLIPPVYYNVVLSVIHLLVLFLSGSIGVFLFIKRVRSPEGLLS